MHAEIDDMLQQAKNSEEKAKKAMVDAARLADELRAEQDHTNTQSKAKRGLETQLAELENKFAEANESAVRGGRAAMAKLETRIREIEIETSRLVLAKTPRASRSQSAAPRSWPSSWRRTRRTRTRCRTWLTSSSRKSRPTRSRSRRPRRLPPSTWPSSARPSRSWRRLRSGPSSLRPRCATRGQPCQRIQSPPLYRPIE